MMVGRKMKVEVLVCLVVAALLMSKGEGMSCGDAVSALIPCGNYLLGSSGPQPSAECCKSAQSLNKLAATTASRKAICMCFKETGPSFGVNPGRAKLLPTLCKLNAKIPISPTVNCNNVS